MRHGRILRWWSRRRLTALLAVVCLAGSWIELTIPDVHDSNVSVVMQASPPESGADGHDAPAADESAHHPDTPSGASHTFHVDHCVHGHFVMIRVVASPNSDPHVISVCPSTRQIELSSVDLPPRFRPPIA